MCSGWWGFYYLPRGRRWSGADMMNESFELDRCDLEFMNQSGPVFEDGVLLRQEVDECCEQTGW